jgi:hypothetical protein
MKQLTEPEFKATFSEPMTQAARDAEPPFDFWEYFNAIPAADFEGHDCSAGSVTYVWTDSTGRFQHVLVNSENKNVFMVLVLDLHGRKVHGHRLLSLNQEYGLEEARSKRTDWPFSEPTNSVAFTTTHITEHDVPILLACHEEDGAWEFLSGGPIANEKLIVVCLNHVFALDNSIGELANLPCGWQAERTAPGQPWIRSVMPPEPPDEST